MPDVNTRIIVSGRDAFSPVAKRIGQQTDQLRGRFTGLADSLELVFGAAGIGGVTFALSDAVDKFKVYESAATDMGKVTARSIADIESDLERVPRRLGDATELMRGYYQVISAGVTEPKAALDLLTTASKAAKSAHIDQETAIRALTKMLAGYQGEITNVTAASDLLFATERLGQTTFAELAPVVGDLATLSHDVGVSQYEMAAALAQTSQTAASTSAAATQVKATLVGLYKPTEKLQQVLSDLGYSSGRALVEQRGLAGALAEIRAAAERAGQPLGELFESQEALVGISSLAAKGFAGFTEKVNEMRQSTGATDRAWENFSGTLESADERFRNNLSDTMTTFGEVIAPRVQRGLESMSDWFETHDDTIADWANKTGSALDTLGSSARGLVDLYTSLPDEVTGAAGAGLMGRLLFGAWGPAALLGALAAAETSANAAQKYLAALNGGQAGGYVDKLFAAGRGEQAWPTFQESVNDLWSDIIGAFSPSGLIKSNNPFDQPGSEHVRALAGQFSTALEDAYNKQNPLYADSSQTPTGWGERAKQLRLTAPLDRRGERDAPFLIDRSPAVIERDADQQAWDYTEEGYKKLVAAAQKRTKEEIAAEKKRQAFLMKSLREEIVERDSGQKKMYASAKKYAQKRTALQLSLNAQHARLTQGRVAYSLSALKTEYDNLKKNLGDSAELEETYAAQRIDTLGSLDSKYYDRRRELLASDLKALEDAGADEVQLAKYASREKVKLAEEEARDRALNADNFADFFRAKCDEELAVWRDTNTRQQLVYQQTWDGMKNIGRDSMRALGNSFGDFVTDGLTGKLENFSDYWDSAWQGMARSFANNVTDMTMTWATSKLFDYGAGFIDAIFHDGSLGVKDDELVALLQQGEIVVPRQQSEQLRAAIGSGGTSNDKFFSEVVGRVEAGPRRDFQAPSGYGFAPDAATVRGMAAGNFLSAVLGGASVGLNNYGRTQQIGKSLQEQGISLDSSRINHVARNLAASGFLSSMYSGVVGSWAGDIGTYALGVYEYAPEANIVTTGLASLLGLGLPGALTGALSPLAAYAMSTVADWLDLRSNEALRDALEDSLGGLVGRQTYQALQRDFTFDLDPMGGVKLKNKKTQKVDYFENKKLAAEAISKHYSESRAGSYDAMVAHNALTFGKDYTDGVWASNDEVQKQSLSVAVAANPSFYGYESRKNARDTLGKNARDSYGEYGGLLGGGWNDGEGHHDGSEGHNVGGEKGSSTGTGGGYNDGHGGVTGLATGGAITSLWVPSGEDGLKPVQFGEGIVSRAGMELLARINSGVDVGADEFGDWYSAAQTNLINALNKQISGQSESVDLLQDQLNTEKTQLDTLRSLSDSVHDARLDLLSGDASPLSDADKFAQLQREWSDTSTRALDGDQDAIRELSSLSSQYLASSKNTASSLSEYRADFYDVARTLSLVETQTTESADAAQTQVGLLQGQLDTAQSLLDATQSELDALGRIETEVIALSDARSEYQIAKDAYSAAQSGAVPESSFDAAAYRAAKYQKLVADGKYDSIAEAAAGYAANQAAAGRTDYQNYILYWENKGKTPGFARGGYHLGGERIVGELGAEAEFTGPARIYNAEQTLQLVGSGSALSLLSALVSAVNTLTNEVRELRREAGDSNSTADRKTDRLLREIEDMSGTIKTWKHSSVPVRAVG